MFVCVFVWLSEINVQPGTELCVYSKHASDSNNAD